MIARVYDVPLTAVHMQVIESYARRTDTSDRPGVIFGHSLSHRAISPSHPGIVWGRCVCGDAGWEPFVPVDLNEGT